MYKKILLIIVLAVLWYKRDSLPFFKHANLAPSLAASGGENPLETRGDWMKKGHLEHISYLDVADPKFDLPDLAELGFYTIIDFHEDDNQTSKSIEYAYKRLLNRRSDLSIIRIDLPVRPPMEARSEEELRRLKAKVDKEFADAKPIKERFAVCDTPHVMIIDPKKKVFRTDNCREKNALLFLRKWFEKENITDQAPEPEPPPGTIPGNSKGELMIYQLPNKPRTFSQPGESTDF